MHKRGKSLRNNSSLSVQSDTPQLTFLTYQEQIGRLRQSRREWRECRSSTGQHGGEVEHKDFSQQQREHLKNAFRYICRLAFKESTKYLPKIRSFSPLPPIPDAEFRTKLTGLLKDAEMISGERYFKEYLQNINSLDQAIIIRYMIWFLENKYLRYLKRTQCEKGKRKNMKKELYLRFKNQIMLPYLQRHLAQLAE